MRLDNLLKHHSSNQHEKGAWILRHDLPTGQCTVSSQRLGERTFSSKEDAQAFIDDHYRGAPDERLGILEIEVVNAKA